MEYILRVENVTKQFAKHTALDDISLSVPRGSVYGLLGPNGAGKSTLIRIINRITAPDKGVIYFGDHILEPSDVFNMGYLPEERGLYKQMKVGEQAVYFARLKGLSKKEAIARLKVWFKHFGIEGWWDKKVSELSKGMAQKVQFIVTILHKPELLIFDEPFSGFDPINANLLKQEILKLRDEGATVIFSTHNMSSVEEICDHITLINNSRNILSGSLAEVRRKYGENVIEVEFNGDRNSLIECVSGRFDVLDNVDNNENINLFTNIRLQMPAEGEMKDMIALINDAVEIRSLRQVIPNMNDIFLKAVTGEPR